MRDASIVFTTTGGGVQLRILHRGGGVTIFTSELTATATGLSAIMTGSGDKMQIVVSTQHASGVIDVNLHGVIQKNVTGQVLREAAIGVPEYTGAGI